MKTICTLFSLMFYGLAINAQVIFDPATCNPESLPKGMSIFETNGSKYLKVSLDGWNANLPIPTVDIGNNNYILAYTAFKPGLSANLQKMKLVVQLNDTTADSNNKKKAEISADATNDFELTYKRVFLHSSHINQIRFAARDTLDWNTISGDTVLVGVIEAFSGQSKLAFDPGSLDPANLPENMELVKGTYSKLLKVKTHGFENNLNIPPVICDSGSFILVETMYEVATGSEKDKRLDIKFGNSIIHSNFESYGSLSMVKGGIPNGVVNNLNVFVLDQSAGHIALDSAIVYIGRIFIKDDMPGHRNIYKITNQTEIAFSQDTIMLDGEKDAAYGQAKCIERVALGSPQNTPSGEWVRIGKNDDTYACWYSTLDNEKIYFYINVYDDNLVLGDGGQLSLRAHDGVEMFVAFTSWTSYMDKVENSLQLSLIPGIDGVLNGKNGLPAYFGDNDTTNIQYVSKITSQGYCFEIAVPLASLFLTKERGVNEASDMVEGIGDNYLQHGLFIDFNVVDIDHGTETKSVLCWGNNTGFDILNNDSFHYRGRALFTGVPEALSIQKDVLPPAQVYPNPAAGYFILQTSNPIESLKVYDHLGRELESFSSGSGMQTTIKSDHWPAGIYLINLKYISGDSETIKVIKKQ
jgi:hypothetical protein